MQVIEHTGSTNADLVVASTDAEAFPHLSVILTTDQRAGRGRLDRQWQAPAGTALALSVLLRVPGLPVPSRGWIPLAAGLALVQAIRAQLPGEDVTVKWPNDVLVGGQKIAGILAEATLEREAIVVGSGVNTSMTAEQLPVPTATSFAVLGAECDLDRLMADYLTALDAAITSLADEAGDAWHSGLHSAVSAVCGTIGRAVKVSMPDGSELLGTAMSLDEQGRLIVESDGVDVPVSAGDVVHVRL